MAPDSSTKDPTTEENAKAADGIKAEPPAPPTSTPAVPAPCEAEAIPTSPRERFMLPIAAAIALSAGLGWSGGLLSRPALPQTTFTSMLQQMANDVGALKEAAVLAGTARAQPVSFGPVITRLDVLGESIDRTQKDVQNRLAGLADRNTLDKALTEKIATLVARLDRIEKSLTTSSLPANRATASINQPLPPRPVDAVPPKLTGYLLREVDGGMAVIEDRHGLIHEVMRGEMVPGAGRIQKIERKGGVWVVVTDKGIIGGL